jgi:hypothetical protein
MPGITATEAVSTAVVGLYAVNALLAASVWLGSFAAVVFVLWIISGRLWDKLRHGIPIFRSSSRPTESTTTDNFGGVSGPSNKDVIVVEKEPNSSVQEAHKYLERRD